MKVSVGQIYIEAGVYFPFSHLWQRWLTEQLTSLAVPSSRFTTKYGPDFKFKIRISARKGLIENEIRGPTVFRKHKEIEYTLFLPYDVVIGTNRGCHAAMEFILLGIQDIFARAHIDAIEIEGRKGYLIERVCSDATMLSEPWPK